jgi:hypothetical protein
MSTETKTTEFDCAAAIRAIGLALNIANGCVATDLPEVEPSETSWRIDHSKELEMLLGLEKHLSSLSTGNDLESLNRNSDPLMLTGSGQ